MLRKMCKNKDLQESKQQLVEGASSIEIEGASKEKYIESSSES